jgi:hypothetical protein
MKRMCVVVACVVLGVVGCSAGEPEPEQSREPTKGQVLREALSDPQNVDVDAWASVPVGEIEAAASSVCEDLAAPGVAKAEVWQHVVDRFRVATADADYFTRASAKLYCPNRQRAAGYL